jgi:hypothetical protein
MHAVTQLRDTITAAQQMAVDPAGTQRFEVPSSLEKTKNRPGAIFDPVSLSFFFKHRFHCGRKSARAATARSWRSPARS